VGFTSFMLSLDESSSKWSPLRTTVKFQAKKKIQIVLEEC